MIITARTVSWKYRYGTPNFELYCYRTALPRHWMTRVVDQHHFNADPDPHQNDKNLRSLQCRSASGPAVPSNPDPAFPSYPDPDRNRGHNSISSYFVKHKFLSNCATSLSRQTLVFNFWLWQNIALSIYLVQVIEEESIYKIESRIAVFEKQVACPVLPARTELSSRCVKITNRWHFSLNHLTIFSDFPLTFV